MIHLKDSGLNVEVHPNFMSEEDSAKLFNYVMDTVEFPYPTYNKNGEKSKKRNGCIFGVIPEYKVGYSDEYVKTVSKWPKPIEELVKYISSIVGMEIHMCLIQVYNDGRSKIAPHRDREIPEGTKIIGLSLGATRKIVFGRFKKEHSVELKDGSLYIMNPPTNDMWSHSIPEDLSITEPRMSFTFRNCANMMP
jgi:alkylated DNA repair dioxygenase AlkB